jgi:AbrB family looped-hinge helix DNA binding protein
MGILMGTTSIDERGRILIPKDIREELDLRPDKQLRIEVQEGSLVIKPLLTAGEVAENLRGCVKGSEVKPQELKRIWGTEHDHH